MVDTAMKTRKEKLEHSMNIEVDFDPSLWKLLNFASPLAVSIPCTLALKVHRGRSAALLKGTREELLAVREEEEELKQDKQSYLQ